MSSALTQYVPLIAGEARDSVAGVSARTCADLPLASPGAEAGTIHALYMHVPFCFHKCHYCDFYSIVDHDDRQQAFTSRMMAELEACAHRLRRPMGTIFVGGGTPTLLAVACWRQLLEALPKLIATDPEVEFTVEANPETVTAELAAMLVAGGVNRVSIGAQSFDRRHLKALERWHDPANVARSVEILRDAGIDNLNLDLIFAVPGQSLDDWLADLDAALALQPDHLSCYGLTYEPNTAMTARLRAGAIQRTDEELEAAMYEATIERLAAAGFEHYEISNWARPGRRCRHNLTYWRNGNWWPIGPSAAGHVGGVRWKNVPRLGEYLDHGPLPPIVDVEVADDATRVGETLMMGLRLIDGIERPRLERLLEADPCRGLRRQAVDRHIDGGLLRMTPTHVRLSRRGLMLADAVIADLLAVGR